MGGMLAACHRIWQGQMSVRKGFARPSLWIEIGQIWTNKGDALINPLDERPAFRNHLFSSPPSSLQDSRYVARNSV